MKDHSPFTLADLVTLVGGELHGGSPETLVGGIAPLDDAGPEDASFFGNPKYLPALRRTAAGVVLVPASHVRDLLALGLPAALVAVANPTHAFSRLIERFAPPAPTYAPGIHHTAVLGENVRVGEGAHVGPHAVVEDDVTIGARSVVGAGVFLGQGTVLGEDCRLHPRVVLREGTQLGHRVVIQPGAVIGGDGFGFELVNGRHEKIPQRGYVQVDDDVEIGANTTIDRARFGRTHIGENTKIDNLVQLAHNVQVGPHCLIVAQTGVSGSTRLGKYVTLAGQAGIVGHITLGDRVVVAAKSGASKDTPPDTVLFGMIGEPVKQAREGLVNVRRLPKLIERVKALEAEVARLRVEPPDPTKS